jgi:hypothetical protein
VNIRTEVSRFHGGKTGQEATSFFLGMWFHGECLYIVGGRLILASVRLVSDVVELPEPGFRHQCRINGSEKNLGSLSCRLLVATAMRGFHVDNKLQILVNMMGNGA